ncbi:MAG: hypothetical protein C0626_07290 [Arcobacter sp.]|uniref:hypothetical protein n=1 Tax=uncultured Arcobacter sp. TaxID=165434 RepID=UPI000CAB877C|nr:hypothetical protein [uncultured Arcobacter sp.]PLY09986.1 MAG: hypothetical protein C0626_07290 [Arcobacter sp.]
MGKPNVNAIDALPKILQRLSNGESLCLINLSKQYDAPITTLHDNIKNISLILFQIKLSKKLVERMKKISNDITDKLIEKEEME